MEAMQTAERDARASQISGLRKGWTEHADSKNYQMDVVSRAGGDHHSPQELDAARVMMQHADSGAADQLYANAIANTPRGIVGNVAHVMGQDDIAGGLARGAVFGGGVTAGGAAMTAGAQKLAAIMGLLGEANETEAARDNELHS
jgi:hypothetical protein